jgi:hypothetical protein
VINIPKARRSHWRRLRLHLHPGEQGYFTGTDSPNADVKGAGGNDDF